MRALVPGMVGSRPGRLREYGTKCFNEVVQPAIDLADGFPLDEMRANSLASSVKLLRTVAHLEAHLPAQRPHRRSPARSSASPTWRAPCARWPTPRRRRSPPGATRAKAIDAVRDYFYRGEIAQKIDAFSKANGGLLRYEDMAAFRLSPKSRSPPRSTATPSTSPASGARARRLSRRSTFSTASTSPR